MHNCTNQLQQLPADFTAHLALAVFFFRFACLLTLFSPLCARPQAANFPFCTIEPNTGRVTVPDPRLDVLAKISKTKSIVPTTFEFVDIAGLVRGASKGEGLGNQFLANIRETDAICQVTDCCLFSVYLL